MLTDRLLRVSKAIAAGCAALRRRRNATKICYRVEPEAPAGLLSFAAGEANVIPATVFLTSGVGVHRHRLTAFEFALRDADIEQQNLVSVSSILPPRCELIARELGVRGLRPGEITFCVLARAETDEPSQLIIDSLSITAASEAQRGGKWTCAIAAAVFLPFHPERGTD